MLNPHFRIFFLVNSPLVPLLAQPLFIPRVSTVGSTSAQEALALPSLTALGADARRILVLGGVSGGTLAKVPFGKLT